MNSTTATIDAFNESVKEVNLKPLDFASLSDAELRSDIQCRDPAKLSGLSRTIMNEQFQGCVGIPTKFRDFLIGLSKTRNVRGNLAYGKMASTAWENGLSLDVHTTVIPATSTKPETKIVDMVIGEADDKICTTIRGAALPVTEDMVMRPRISEVSSIIVGLFKIVLVPKVTLDYAVPIIAWSKIFAKTSFDMTNAYSFLELVNTIFEPTLTVKKLVEIQALTNERWAQYVMTVLSAMPLLTYFILHTSICKDLFGFVFMKKKKTGNTWHVKPGTEAYVDFIVQMTPTDNTQRTMMQTRASIGVCALYKGKLKQADFAPLIGFTKRKDKCDESELFTMAVSSITAGGTFLNNGACGLPSLTEGYMTATMLSEQERQIVRAVSLILPLLHTRVSIRLEQGSQIPVVWGAMLAYAKATNKNLTAKQVRFVVDEEYLLTLASASYAVYLHTEPFDDGIYLYFSRKRYQLSTPSIATLYKDANIGYKLQAAKHNNIIYCGPIYGSLARDIYAKKYAIYQYGNCDTFYGIAAPREVVRSLYEEGQYITRPCLKIVSEDQWYTKVMNNIQSRVVAFLFPVLFYSNTVATVRFLRTKLAYRQVAGGWTEVENYADQREDREDTSEESSDHDSQGSNASDSDTDSGEPDARQTPTTISTTSAAAITTTTTTTNITQVAPVQATIVVPPVVQPAIVQPPLPIPPQSMIVAPSVTVAVVAPVPQPPKKERRKKGTPSPTVVIPSAEQVEGDNGVIPGKVDTSEWNDQ